MQIVLKLVAAREFALISSSLPPLNVSEIAIFQENRRGDWDRMPSYKTFPPTVLGRKGFDQKQIKFFIFKS